MSDVALSYVNLYAAIGAAGKFAELDETVRSVVSRGDVALRIKVKGGPDGLILFHNGRVRSLPFDGRKHDACFVFPSPKDFNIFCENGKGAKIRFGSLKSLFRASFVFGSDSPLKKLLSAYRALLAGREDSGEAQQDNATAVVFFAAIRAAAQVASTDMIAAFAAERMPEGEILLEIADKYFCSVIKKDGRIFFSEDKPEHPIAICTFTDMLSAHDFFYGESNIGAVLASGEFMLKGNMRSIEGMERLIGIASRYIWEKK